MLPVPAEKMHPDEVEIDEALVGRLLDAQFPDWADLPIVPVPSSGTENALYRLGDDLVVRLPRIRGATGALGREQEWLPQLAPFLPLAVPVPLAAGAPGTGYPWHWSVYRWLGGETGMDGLIDLDRAAVDLAQFVLALQRVDPTDGPRATEHNSLRGGPLAWRDAATRAAIVSLGDAIEGTAVAEVWDAALAAPEWRRPPVWIHGDLDARNVLVERGRLCAVIDFGCLAVGDPACDVMVAWKLFPPASRDTFRATLSVDDATWARARGWVLSQALLILSYYTVETNPILLREGQRWLDAVLADRP